ncbi:hypothetical protein [Rhizobium sp. CF142]|uniref:hypothetical protein n=1 Tax=Rhizobium sp. CF142 TaxID=1144314 RepID=UPI00026EFBE4|nr:hypothetical protein [Rhizobium sp. CF142]EJJ26484.1 hypothetical protein PMI11_05402 [Rhizobium sp. CF142]
MQLGLSESARATTAEEARFRINYPNSRPRKSRVIALDKTAEATLERLAAGYAGGYAHFLRYIEAKPASNSLKMLPVDAVLEDLSGKRAALVDEITDADVIVMLTTAGSSAEAAEVIGNACFVRSKMTTGLVVSSADVAARSRPHADGDAPLCGDARHLQWGRLCRRDAERAEGLRMLRAWREYLQELCYGRSFTPCKQTENARHECICEGNGTHEKSPCQAQPLVFGHYGHPPFESIFGG